MRIGAVSLALMLAGPGAASAQFGQLPPTNRGEATASGINRSLQTQEQGRVIQQQNQFEVNSLRNDMSRQVAPPSVVPGAPVVIGR